MKGWIKPLSVLKCYYYTELIYRSYSYIINTCSKVLWQFLPWFYGPVHSNVISAPWGTYSSILKSIRCSELVLSTCIHCPTRLPMCQVGRMWRHWSLCWDHTGVSLFLKPHLILGILLRWKLARILLLSALFCRNGKAIL